jgi:hypothetical protein
MCDTIIKASTVIYDKYQAPQLVCVSPCYLVVCQILKATHKYIWRGQRGKAIEGENNTKALVEQQNIREKERLNCIIVNLIWE